MQPENTVWTNLVAWRWRWPVTSATSMLLPLALVLALLGGHFAIPLTQLPPAFLFQLPKTMIILADSPPLCEWQHAVHLVPIAN